MFVKNKRVPETETTNVYILEGGGTPFLKENSVVRFPVMSMAGATTSVEVEGAGRLIRRSHIVRMYDGPPPVGAQEEEFEVQLTGRGKVVVKVTVKYPTSDVPEVTEHVIGVS